MSMMAVALLLGVSTMMSDTVRVEQGRHVGAGGTRDYRVAYSPDRPAESRPVLVVLHGCLQGADDIARGTRFDARAASELGWLVVYPEQPASAQPNRCWTWYDPAHQQRDEGEPALLIGILDEVLASHGGDDKRVYLVGVSAGGAMAANLVGLYPERFAALGVHSGVSAFGATNVTMALAAMQANTTWRANDAAEALRAAMGEGARAMPLLVLHGEADAVVRPENAQRLAQQFRDLATLLQADVPIRCLRIPGLGHAWAGGDPAGSFTAESSVNATSLFLDFFAAVHPRE